MRVGRFGAYAHLETEDLREAINLLGPSPEPLDQEPEQAASIASGSCTGDPWLATRLLPESELKARLGKGGPRIRYELRGQARRAMQESNLRPLASEANALSS